MSKLKKAFNFLNQHKKNIGFILIIILTYFLSFGLGYLAAEDDIRTPIIIEKNSTN